ncbi:MAG: DNA polymerase family B elongation subunit [Barrevirus sp.]|uniref:DNA polymerase family B elongation subunit n=1 Tax=Barrevirus sp. TaxID=2487763 RepID=A0A3G4ZRN0_9VIRU|nr:MAG: DNA polymerase family B elongation subunit [Barrevirus sp.]
MQATEEDDNNLKKSQELANYKNMLISDTDIIASIHVECLTRPNSFPNPDHEDDKVSLIATTFHTKKEGVQTCIFKSVIKYDANIVGSPIFKMDNDITIESHDSEKDVIWSWIRLLEKLGTKLVIGWYIFNLDLLYLEKRAAKLGIGYFYETRIGNIADRVKEDKFTPRKCYLVDKVNKINKLDLMRYIEVKLHMFGPFATVAKQLGLNVPILESDKDKSFNVPVLKNDIDKYTIDCCLTYLEMFYKIKVIDGLNELYKLTEQHFDLFKSRSK